MGGLEASQPLAERKTVIGITGMPGSGKSTLAEIAESLGFKKLVMGDFVRAEAERRGLKPTGENLGLLMLQLRREMGEAAIAEMTVKATKKLGSDKIVIDGVRSPAEIDEFKKNFPGFKLIAVHAPREVRFTRLTGRRRSDDPKAWEAFQDRDLRELEVGVGSAIALADRILENIGELEAFKRQAVKLLREVLEGV